MKFNIIQCEKLNHRAKQNLKILEKKFNNSIFKSQQCIIDNEIKVQSNNFKIYKVKLADLKLDDAKSEINCSIKTTYAITDSHDRILYVTPNTYTYSAIQRPFIDDLEFLTTSKSNVCVEFSEILKKEFLVLKKYADDTNKQSYLEK